MVLPLTPDPLTGGTCNLLSPLTLKRKLFKALTPERKRNLFRSPAPEGKETQAL